MDKVPGRFNLLEIHGATVIVDYGHNAHALAALIAAVEQFPPSHRTCVYSTAGDRRDCDMIRQGELLGAAFDRVILYEDHSVRGRPDGEIIRLIRQGMSNGSRVKQIEEIHGADAAVELALRTAQRGELMLVQADTIDETVQCVRRYVESIAPEPIVAVEEALAPVAAPAAKPVEELAEAPTMAQVAPITPRR